MDEGCVISQLVYLVADTASILMLWRLLVHRLGAMQS